MFTVCPKCALNLAVTAADLRIGQGYVRCGRCTNVFNALLGLSEESHDPPDQGKPTPARPASLASAPAPAAAGALPPPVHEPVAPTHSPAVQTPAELAVDDQEQDITLQGVRLTVPPAPAAAATAPAPEQSSAALAPVAARTAAAAPRALRLIESPPRPAPIEAPEPEELRATGNFETIVLEGDTFLQTEELVPEEAFDTEVAAVSQRLEPARSRGLDVDASAAESEPDPDDTPTQISAFVKTPRTGTQLTALQPAPPPEEAPFAAPRRARTWPSVAALALLGLLLVAQAADHWRDDLVTRPGLHELITRWCAALGRSVAPNWDLAAYDVRQLGAGADSGDPHAIRVRFALANHARKPQAFPLVRLTLLDRYGKSLSAGELQPVQYLPAALRAERMMAPDQRIDTEIGITDASQQASSFELDVCTAAAGGGVRCAGDGVLAGGGAAP